MFDCSALPSTCDAPASHVLINDDFKAEIARLAALLKDVASQAESAEDRPPASVFEPILCQS